MTRRNHGGDLHHIKRHYPDAPLPWIDLSTGINPVAYPWQQKISSEILTKASNRLPGTADYDQCRVAYARYLNSDPEKIFLSAGSQAIIEALPRLFPQSEVFILGPTYGEHQHSWERHGHRIHFLPYAATSLSHILEGSISIITSPNNPDGQFIDPGELYHFICRLCQKGGTAIIDEAFMDLTPENSILNTELPSGVLVLRSLGKFFGLAGLRIGALYASNRDFGKRLSELSALWTISTLSLTIASHALMDESWITENRLWLSRSMTQLSTLIRAAGYDIIGQSDLFCLIRGDNIPDLYHHMARHGIFTRIFEHYPHQMRLGLPGSEAAFSRLEHIFQEFPHDKSFPK